MLHVLKFHLAITELSLGEETPTASHTESEVQHSEPGKSTSFVKTHSFLSGYFAICKRKGDKFPKQSF